jgi:triphosphatase
MYSTEKERRETREIEVKLAFDPSDRNAIETHPLLAGTLPAKKTLLSVYYDTEDLLLRKAQLALRVRRVGGRFVQGLKSMERAGELFDRAEWEHEIGAEQPRLDLYNGTPLDAFFAEQVGGRLVALFRTDVERTAYTLVREGSEIEASIDLGSIQAGGRHAPIHELELELLGGDPGELFRLARQLAETVPLRLAVKTKAERGYELADGVTGVAEKALPIALDPDMSCGQAFRAIGQNCLRQIVANEEGMLAADAEGLHHMRIGLRRLRAAISLFSKMLTDAERERIEGELKWIGRELGAARDLDVIAADLLRDAEEAGKDLRAEIRGAIAPKRNEAYGAAIAALHSPRYRTALLDIAAWMEAGPWTSDEALSARRERPIEAHAAKVLGRFADYVRLKGRRLRKLDPKKRHKLRIRGKTLRYAVEFFASLYAEDKRVKRRQTALAALKDLQDHLGKLNDLAARKKLAASGNGVAPHTSSAMLAGESDAEGLLRRAEEAHVRFAATKPFWR